MRLPFWVDRQTANNSARALRVKIDGPTPSAGNPTSYGDVLIKTMSIDWVIPLTILIVRRPLILHRRTSRPTDGYPHYRALLHRNRKLFFVGFYIELCSIEHLPCASLSWWRYRRTPKMLHGRTESLTDRSVPLS